MLAAIIFFQVIFAAVAVAHAVPTYSHAFQVSCLTVGLYEQLSWDDQLLCEEFFQSNDFAGMSIVWQSYYVNSASDGNYRVMLHNFQKEHFCCGNGLPLHCVNDSRAFPSAYPDPARRKQRRQCEAHGSFLYPPTKDCKLNARCAYDLPYGTCGQNPVTSSSRGCGAFVYQALAQQVQGIGIAALVFLLFPVSLFGFSATSRLSHTGRWCCSSCSSSARCACA